MFRLCTLLCLIWACSTVNAQVGFQVSPGKIFFRQVTNQPGSQTIRVTNPTPSEMVLQCSFADWRRDSSGQKIYFEAGSQPGSNSRYLRVNPENFTLKAGESRLIEVTMTLPEGMDRQVTRSMLFITQTNEKDLARQSATQKAAMIFQVQMGVHIYNEPPQLQSKNIDIEDVTFTHVGPKGADSSVGSNRLNAFISNIGERVTMGTVRFELTNKTTLEEWKSKPEDFNTLPGDKFFVSTVLPSTLAKGKYALITIADFGADQPLKVAESEIEIH